MSSEDFLKQLDEVRHLVRDRLAAVRRGERVHGDAQELEGLLASLADAEVEVRTGKFNYPREQRRLPGVREILDTWPFDDAVGGAFMDLAGRYREL